ncbi:MAG: hypothetical protein ACFCVG_06650 [Kineosporiaceae bacterium]
MSKVRYDADLDWDDPPPRSGTILGLGAGRFTGVEVDVIVETPDGQVVGIEVKSATTADRSDARGLRFLAARLGPRFRLGLVLTTGPGSAQLDERIWVTPVSSLWTRE